jgi:hypothetical protein
MAQDADQEAWGARTPMEPQEYDEMLRTLVRIAAHQETINDNVRAVLSRPSENEAATSGNVALPIYKTMSSSTRLTCATEAKYLCHNSFDGRSIGTLILTRLVAQL